MILIRKSFHVVRREQVEKFILHTNTFTDLFFYLLLILFRSFLIQHFFPSAISLGSIIYSTQWSTLLLAFWLFFLYFLCYNFWGIIWNFWSIYELFSSFSLKLHLTNIFLCVFAKLSNIFTDQFLISTFKFHTREKTFFTSRQFLDEWDWSRTTKENLAQCSKRFSIHSRLWLPLLNCWFIQEWKFPLLKIEKQ